VKIRTFASALTHVLFVSLFALAAAKYAKQPGPAEAEDAAREAPAPKQAAAMPAARGPEIPGPTESLDTLRPEEKAPSGPGLPQRRAQEESVRTPAAAPGEAIAETGAAPQAERPLSRAEKLMSRLVAAYPGHLSGYEDNAIIWHDGTRMPFDDGRDKTFREKLTDPDLEDQFYTAYPRGLRGVPPLEDIDPGRVRYEPFFVKMYGDCKQDKAAVRANLEQVVWLPENYGKTLRVTRINGVADALRNVSAALDKLPARFMKYLRPSAGTYHCRTIAGTDRFSVHAFGAAVDINAKYGDYWRWSQPQPGESLTYRNRIPWEIVEIFEQHGFIWGGKWYHYDTLHFEYRPELLNAAPRPLAPAPERRPPQRAER